MFRIFVLTYFRPDFLHFHDALLFFYDSLVQHVLMETREDDSNV